MYTIKTSERNNDKATEYETKSLLYLFTKIKGHEKIDWFIIDCCNDVTGVNENYSESWDLQSKGVDGLTSKKIGAALYTLFANHVSDISFNHYILYLPPIKAEYKKTLVNEIVYSENFKEKNLEKIKEGLKEEILRRSDSQVIGKMTSIDRFLQEVVLIEDSYKRVEYIRNIIQFKNLDKLEDEFLEKIFNEIRVLQAAKKIYNVYGQTLNSLQDTVNFNKTISRKDIESLVVNRVVGNDLFTNKGIPIYFTPEIQGMEFDEISDILQDCQSKIAKTLFNKNNKKTFWRLLEQIMEVILNSPNEPITNIATKIDSSLTSKVFTLDNKALLYLIALVKEGLKNENS